MPTFQDLERAFLNADKAGDKETAGLLARELRRQVELSKSTSRKEEPEKLNPQTRNPLRVASDTVITIANSFAGGIEAAADFVAPGNAFSKAIDKFTKYTENLQSDMVKAGREEFQRNLQAAETAGEEVAAVAKYVAQNPLQAAGQAVGSFIGPGVAIKGSVKAAQLLKLTEKASSRVGLGAGVVTNAMMAGGDAGGSAYKMVMDTPDEILLKNDYIREQVEKGVSLEKLKEEAATNAARRASFLPALIGGATGAFGVERFLAGAGGKAAATIWGGAIKTGISESIQEAVEEGVTEYSGRKAAQEYDPRIDPMKGVAGAATLGAVLGAIPGAGIGALETRNALAAEAAKKDLEAQQASAQAEQSAAAIVPQAQAVQAQAQQAAQPPATLPFGIITPDQVGTAINQAAPAVDADAQLDTLATRQGQPTLPPEKQAITNLVGNAYAKHGGTREASKALKPQLEAMGIPADEQKAIISEIREALNIPKNNTKEGREAFAVWAQQWEELQSGEQLAGANLAGDQSGATGASSELAGPPGGTPAPINARLDGSGRNAEPTIVPAENQRPALKQTGQINYGNNEVYTGEIINNLPNGKGSYKWPDGSVYDGDFVDGLLSGNGTLTYPDGYVETGIFKDDELFTGQAITTNPDGSKTIDTYKDNKLIKEEPNVPAPIKTKQAKKEGQKKEPPPPVEEPAPKVEKKDYAATERLFKKEHMPFVMADVDTRAAPPKSMQEAISHAGAEEAFDDFDTALETLNKTYAAQIKAENDANTAKFKENEKLGIPSAKSEKVTIYDILGRMTQSEREATVEKAIDASKLKPRKSDKKQVRDAFVKSLSEIQKKDVAAKRKETLAAEIKAVSKLGKKSVSDIREARKKAAATSVAAAPKPGKAQPVTTRKVEEKKESENIIDRETITALRSGNPDSVLRAIKVGYTDPATKLFASQIEKVISQLGIKPTIVIGKVEGNRPAQYDPSNETITVDPDAPRDTMLDTVVLHEFAHFITDRAVDNPQNLTPIQKVALDNLAKLHEHVKEKLGKKYEIDSIKEFLAQAFSNSEFAADMAKMPPLSKVIKAPNTLREFAIRVMQLLGIKTGDTSLGQVLENIQTMITGPFDVRAPLSPKIPGLAKGISYMGEPKEPKKAEGYKGKSTEEFIADHRLPERPKGFFGSIKSWFAGGYSGRFNEFVRNYQNEQHPIKVLQRQLERTGLLEYGDEETATNIHDVVALAPGNFNNLNNTYVNPILNRINDKLVNMVKETGRTVDDVLIRLASYGEVLHEGEVRAVKYIKNVPLRSDDDAKIIRWYDNKDYITPATVRNEILAELKSKNGLAKRANSLGMTTTELAQAYRKLLDDIIADKRNLDPSKPEKHDINSDHYDVLGKLDSDDVKRHLAYFDQNKAEKKMMDDILAELQALSEVTIMLNKQANYWSPQVDNLVDFYGYKNYVTYKGKPLKDEDADLFYGGEQMLGKELQQKEYTQEGRYTLPDNPILTMMADASIAASRSGRKDITKTLYNLVKNKGNELIDGKVEKIVSFEERYNLREDEKLFKLMNKQNVFLHYMPDGEVAVISVKDERLRNALRKTYQKGSGFFDRLNTITSFMGQTHTRFNIAFAPKNFVQDVLANAFNISVDMTPGAARNYIGAIANKVVTNGFIKSYQVAGAFYEGGADPAKNPRLKALLAKDKSGHVKDLLDYLQNGGDIAYVSSFSAKGQFRDVIKTAERSSGVTGVVVKGWDGTTRFFDQYMAGFEFTSRAAAFKIRKTEIMNQLMKKGMSRAEADAAANKPAAAFAKGLANFEEKGLKSKQLSAWFMFYNAAATGAVRVIEPLAPALASAAESIRAGVTLKSPFQGYQAAADRAWAELPKTLRDKGNKEEFIKKYIEQAKRGKNTTAALLGFGVAMYYLAYAGAGEDDYGRNRVATDDMSRWMRNARFFVGDGINDIINIPWGFGMGAFPSLGAQFAALGNSDTKFSEVAANSITILMDSFLPLPVSKGSIVEKPAEYIIDSIMPAPLRPLVEFTMNYNSLGQEIYNGRQGPNGSVYTGGDNVPKIFKDASVFLYENTGFEFGPNEMHFLASSYIDAWAKMGAAGWNLFTLSLSGEDNRSAMEQVKQDILPFSGFIGARSDYDARKWSIIEKDLTKRRDRLNELEEANPEAYYRHLEENPLDEFLVKQFNKDANGELKKLRTEAKEIRRSSAYDFSTKKELLEANRVMASLLKMQLVDMYTAMGYEF